MGRARSGARCLAVDRHDRCFCAHGRRRVTAINIKVRHGPTSFFVVDPVSGEFVEHFGFELGSAVIYRFGEFELDDALLELRYRGSAELVPPRVLRTILYLIQHRTRAVSRDEILEVIWGGLAVSDAALSQTIMLARKATRDEGEQQSVIKTVRGHGFRFVADVTELEQRATSPAAAPPPVDEAREPLFGRDREIAFLTARLETAERGRGSLVLVQGEPGIGKTHLAETFGARAMARGAHVFWARSWEDGGAPAFWPFTQVLRAVCARYGSETVKAFLDERCSELRGLVPELALSSAAVDDDPLDPTEAQFRVFDAMSRMLRRMANALHREKPELSFATSIVIAFDDLHAADDASIQCLRFLASELGGAPLLIVGMFRDLPGTERGPLVPLLGGPLENTHRLALSGLSAPDVARLAQRLVGRELAPRTATQLYELSNGNPFLVGELTRFSQGEVELSALAILRVPERMASAVRRRLERLPEATHTLLELAAVLGVEFTLAHLHAASSGSNEDLLRDLEPALRSGTLEPVSGSAGARLRFAHALVRDTLYGELALVRRLSLHRTVAEALEAAASPDALPIYELARHYYLAAPAGFALKAVDYARKAAAQAVNVSAFDTAATLYDRAVELSMSTFSPESWVLHWEMRVDAGDAWFSAGELERAFERYSAAAELARDHRDADRLAVAVLKCVRARRGFTWFSSRLLALIGQTLELQGPADSALKSLLLGFRGVTGLAVRDVDERDNATREAVEMARRIDDDHAVVLSLQLRRWLTTGVLPSTATREIASEVVSVARRTNHHEGILDGLFWRMQDHLALGDLARAELDLTEYTELAERGHNILHRYWGAWFHAMRRALFGDFATANDLADAALAWGRRIREPLAAELHALLTWNNCVFQGKPCELPAALVALLDREHAFGRAFQLGLRIATSPDATAGHLYDELTRTGFDELMASPYRNSMLALLCASCARFDDRTRAKRLYQLLLPDAAQHVVPPGTWLYIAPVEECLAQLAVCLRDYDRAAAHFERAMEACEQLAARPHLARVQYQYARTLEASASRAPELADELHRRVKATSDKLGTAREWPLPAALRSVYKGES